MDTTSTHSFDRGGDRNYAALPQAKKDALDFVTWATTVGAVEGGPTARWAADAARHLQITAPDRFAKAVASWQAGRGADVYAALVALAEEAAR